MIFKYAPDENNPDRKLIRTPEHIAAVLNEIKNNFDSYFDKFLATEAGATPSTEDFQNAQVIMGVNVQRSTKSPPKQNLTMAFRNIVKDSIDKYERDRDSYRELLDSELLDEAADDTNAFKNSTLRRDCPLIRNILHSPADVLKDYKEAFNRANSSDLYKVIVELSNFSVKYANEFSSYESYEAISDLTELDLMELEGIGYPNVIGYGVSSHLLYKNNSELFPNRNANAIWALWFLTQKKTFGCQEDSEFLMIKVQESLTEHNFFYPYYLYVWYAYNIYKMLKEKAKQLDVNLDREYRYVIVDAYMNFIADQNKDNIILLSRQIPNDGLGWQYG